MAHDVDHLLAQYNGEIPPECEDGETRCNGTTLEKCLAGLWYPWEENSTECGYTPNGDEGAIWEWIKENAVWLGAGGAAVAGVLLLIIPKKKQK